MTPEAKHTPSLDEIRREGWTTPAAEYWRDMFNKLESSEAKVRLSHAKLVAALRLLLRRAEITGDYLTWVKDNVADNGERKVEAEQHGENLYSAVFAARQALRDAEEA